ncbi:MAG: sulfatase [Actinomycetota bacterium]|nr:sulfatase [Actinomycetota bacterium]
MNGRKLIGIAAAATLFAAVATGSQARTQRAAPKPPPNIIVIETDDQTLEELAVLPKTRRLIGDEGVTFDNNFDSFSLCCPSRATLLTGQYSHNNGVRGNQLPEGGYYKLDSTNTLAVWLQRGGYYTAHVGKYLNGYGTRNPREIPPGWSDWHGAVDPSTYRYYNYTLNENGILHTYCAPPRKASCYQTDVYRDKADEIIRRQIPQSQPLFMWVAFLADHSGGPRESDDPAGLGTPVPAPRHRNAFRNLPLPTPPSLNEADVSDKPVSIQRRRLMTQAQINAVRENYQQRRESLLAVDDAVESIVNTLAASGELENTMIMFTSDNGFFHGEHRVRSGKVLLYEPSIRVPLLLRGPGIPQGVHRKQLTMNVDYAPTIVAAAGVRAGRVMDGMSLLPLALDGARQPGRDLLVDNQPGAAHFDAVRTRRFKYAEYATGERELYDLARDPYELQSLHIDPRYASVRTSLSTRLHRLVACRGSGCRVGPPLRLSLRCVRRSFVARVRGSGIQLATFYVNGRRVRADRKAPFAVAIGRGRQPTRGLLRVRVTLSFDRMVTIDRSFTRCR